MKMSKRHELNHGTGPDWIPYPDEEDHGQGIGDTVDALLLVLACAMILYGILNWPDILRWLTGLVHRG